MILIGIKNSMLLKNGESNWLKFGRLSGIYFKLKDDLPFQGKSSKGAGSDDKNFKGG